MGLDIIYLLKNARNHFESLKDSMNKSRVVKMLRAVIVAKNYFGFAGRGIVPPTVKLDIA